MASRKLGECRTTRDQLHNTDKIEMLGISSGKKVKAPRDLHLLSTEKDELSTAFECGCRSLEARLVLTNIEAALPQSTEQHPSGKSKGSGHHCMNLRYQGRAEM